MVTGYIPDTTPSVERIPHSPRPRCLGLTFTCEVWSMQNNLPNSSWWEKIHLMFFSKYLVTMRSHNSSWFIWNFVTVMNLIVQSSSLSSRTTNRLICETLNVIVSFLMARLTFTFVSFSSFLLNACLLHLVVYFLFLTLSLCLCLFPFLSFSHPLSLLILCITCALVILPLAY